MSREEDEAKAILARVERESTGPFESALARATRHFSGADAPPGDRIELWGRRIGRILSLVAFVFLAVLLLYQLRRT